MSLNANSPPNPKRTFPAKRGVVPARHGTSSFNDACAPSNDKDTRTLLGALGYVMVAPDSIGLRAFGGATGFPPYLVGQPTAIASLEAVRAALQRFTRTDAPLCVGARFPSAARERRLMSAQAWEHMSAQAWEKQALDWWRRATVCSPCPSGKHA